MRATEYLRVQYLWKPYQAAADRLKPGASFVVCSGAPVRASAVCRNAFGAERCCQGKTGRAQATSGFLLSQYLSYVRRWRTFFLRSFDRRVYGGVHPQALRHHARGDGACQTSLSTGVASC